MKIKTPAHHQCCDDARREAQEIVEEICSHSPKVEVDETRRPPALGTSSPEAQAKV
jgi:hypothetical protein